MTGSRGWMLCGGLMGLVAVQALGGCGGQTGGVISARGDVPDCEVSEVTVDLDQRLPVDFTLRELADAVAGEHELPGFWVELSDDVVPPIAGETRVKVTVTYEDQPVPVEDCRGQSGQPHVPVNVTVEELGGEGAWDFDAIASGTPRQVRVTALASQAKPQAEDTDAGGLGALAGPYDLFLLVEPEGLSGTVGAPTGGLHLRVGTACGGHTELPPKETADGWAASPAAVATSLEALLLSAGREGDWMPASLVVDGLGSLACYRNSVPLGVPWPADGSLPPTRPTAEVQLSASVSLGAGRPAFELEGARLSLWPVDACPVQGEDVCFGYQLRGCSDVTDDEAVAALYPEDVVVAASACFYLEGVTGVSTTAMGRVEIGADLDAMKGDDIRIEGEPIVWTINIEGE